MCDPGESFDREFRQWRTARNAHTCVACDETIRPGDRYHITNGLFDGQWDSFKHCVRCWRICVELWAAGVATVDFTLDCGDSWHDAFDGDPPAEVAELAFMSADDGQAYYARSQGES